MVLKEAEAPWVVNNWMKNEVVCVRDNKNPHTGNCL